MMTVQSATLLRRAAQLIRDDGWVQFTRADGDRRCALQALMDAGGLASDAVHSEALVALHESLFGRDATSEWKNAIVSQDIVCWNDRFMQSADAVATAMDKAADGLDAGQGARVAEGVLCLT